MSDAEPGLRLGRRNLLLARLTDPALRQVMAIGQAIQIERRQILRRPDEQVGFVYFPFRGWLARIASFSDGFQVEVNVVGREGMVGLPLVHGINFDRREIVAEVPGDGFRIPAPAFRAALQDIPELQTVLLRYSYLVRVAAEQRAACNSHHTLEKRLALSLLEILDRSDETTLAVTQETLATLLCVHRPNLTIAAARLQRAGFTRHAGGRISILDRDGLEDAACECYALLRDTLFPVAASDLYER